MRSGSTSATRPVMIPAASSFWIRFQHGVCDSPTRSAICATESVASRISSARILRSMRSSLSIGNPLGHLPGGRLCGKTAECREYPWIFGSPHGPEGTDLLNLDLILSFFAGRYPMISQKTKYALKALMTLADVWAEKPGTSLTIEEIARRSGTPKRFLEHILLELRNAGYIGSRRGRAGGYMLIKEPRSISLSELLRRVDGPIAPLPCLS